METGSSVVPHQLILTIPQLKVAGFHPVFGGLGSGAGTTGGVLYKPPFAKRKHLLASLEVLGSMRSYYGGEALVGQEVGERVGYAYARYQHRPREQFFGVGPDSKKGGKSVYRLSEGIVGGLLGHAFAPNTLLGGHVSFQWNRYGTGQGDLPRVEDHFASLPGVGTDLEYLMVGAFFEFDSRDTPYSRAFGHRFAPTENRLRSVSLEASRGFYLATEVTHNIDTRKYEFDFTRFTLDMREFVPIDEDLLHGFAFRQFASFTQSSDGQMPFYRLQSIGGARSLRGYPTGRFRDRNVVLVNAEVRCQVWHWLDMALFTDAGQVFRSVGDAPLRDPHLGYGLGFRLKKDGQTLGRVDIVRSERGWSTHLDLGSLF